MSIIKYEIKPRGDMVNSRFTKKANEALESSKKVCKELGGLYIGTEHLLLGILSTDCVGSKILNEKGVFYNDCLKRIRDALPNEARKHSLEELSPRAKRAIEGASQVSKRFGGRFIGSEHILYSICNEPDSFGARILISLEINLQSIKTEITSFLDTFGTEQKNEKVPNAGSAILTYGKNLNKLALCGGCDPLYKRDGELSRLMQILTRRTKNNPCLIGEPGVGKTAIVEGLAEKIVRGEVPRELADKTVISLDLSSMVAGAKYRGEFEERLKNVLNEVKSNRSIILFIDEIHTIVGAGAAEGAVDAANIIKPSLARGEIQLIGATTISEYRKHIEKDSALERRFQPIIIKEPSESDAIDILLGLREKYEEFHGVKITNEAIKQAVLLSKRYIGDRFLPDKAIDLIDEACSRVKMKHQHKTPKMREYEKKIVDLSRDKENAIAAQNFELASRLRDDEIGYKIAYNKEKAKRERLISKASLKITEHDIGGIVTLWTGIPVVAAENNEALELSQLERKLANDVCGQGKATRAVADAITRARVGLKNPKKPLGSFLFLGPTGVGKTLLAKSIAKNVFGSESNIIRIDMSEYMEKHSVSRLIGAPPGYVGYDEGGQLSSAVRLKPYSVVLFDEIEKAHKDVYNILLGILDEGILTDSQGRTVDFKNTILILTSNIGAKSITEPKRLGFSEAKSDEVEYENVKSKIQGALKAEFNPEFLNRLDEIVIFNQLTKADIGKICKSLLNEVKETALGVGITLDVKQNAIDYLAEKSFDKLYGARPLRRTITNMLENPLSKKIASGEIKRGDTVLVELKGGELVIKSAVAT